MDGTSAAPNDDNVNVEPCPGIGVTREKRAPGVEGLIPNCACNPNGYEMIFIYMKR